MTTSSGGRHGTHLPGFDRYIRTEERRAYHRWQVRVAVECHLAGGPVKADVLEMSEGGLTFTSDREFKIGDEITLHCYLTQHAKPINVKAAVRQLRGNRIGTEFLNLRLKDRLRIQEFFAAPAKVNA